MALNAGLIGAEIASWAAFSPSLMPRTAVATTIVTFTAQLTGHVVGVAANYSLKKVGTFLSGGPHSVWIPPALLPSSRKLAIPPRIQRRLVWATHGVIATTTAAVWLRSATRQRDIAKLIDIDGKSSLRAQLSATAAATGFYLATRGLTELADRSYTFLRHQVRPWVPTGFAPVAAGAVVGGSVAVAVDKLVVRKVLESIARKSAQLNNLVLPGRMQPWEPERSGSPWSLEPWHALGAQGRVAVADGARVRDIEAVTSADSNDIYEPIRIYAGKVRGRSIQNQAELIVRELHRTGAFRRNHLVVHTSTGTGWLPNWSLHAVEFLTLGNCAQVGLQYSDLPSPVAWLTDHETPQAAGRILFERIFEEWSKLPADNRPKLLVAGESLGAFGGLSAFSNSAEMLQKIDGAVWSGTPRFTSMWKELTESRDADSPEIAPVINGGKHIRFATCPAELWHTFNGADLPDWQFPRIAFLQHASDPIVWWDYPLLWRRPTWLAERLGRDVVPTMRWFPVVTFWQVLIDGLASVDVPGGHGHRYEEEMFPAWAAVLGISVTGKDKELRTEHLNFKRVSKWIRRNQPPRA